VSDKKKYRICHLLYEEYPRDPRVRRYVNAVNETGINCIIICSRKKNEKYFEELNNNRIYRIPVSHLFQVLCLFILVLNTDLK